MTAATPAGPGDLVVRAETHRTPLPPAIDLHRAPRLLDRPPAHRPPAVRPLPMPARRKAGAAACGVLTVVLLGLGLYLLLAGRPAPCTDGFCLPGTWETHPRLTLALAAAGVAGAVGTGIYVRGVSRLTGDQFAVLLGSILLTVGAVTGVVLGLVVLGLAVVTGFAATLQLLAATDPIVGRR